MTTPKGHYIYEEEREGETLTFTVCDNIGGTCPEFDPETGELINILREDRGMKHLVTCEECLQRFNEDHQEHHVTTTEGVRKP